MNIRKLKKQRKSEGYLTFNKAVLEASRLHELSPKFRHRAHATALLQEARSQGII